MTTAHSTTTPLGSRDALYAAFREKPSLAYRIHTHTHATLSPSGINTVKQQTRTAILIG